MNKEQILKEFDSAFEWVNPVESAKHWKMIYGVAPADIRAFLVDALDRYEAQALETPNGLLRSAYSIAVRRGKETNWDAFTKQLGDELAREHKIMYPSSKASTLTNQKLET